MQFINTSLKVLMLGSDRIGDRSAIAIAKVLEKNKTLQILGLVYSFLSRCDMVSST